MKILAAPFVEPAELCIYMLPRATICSVYQAVLPEENKSFKPTKSVTGFAVPPIVVKVTVDQ